MIHNITKETSFHNLLIGEEKEIEEEGKEEKGKFWWLNFLAVET